MRELPSLFCGPMVRAILDGRKTQTRRVCASRRNCDAVQKWFWDRLEWGDRKVPAGAPETFADDGYLHVATRPHPDDPQDADLWTRSRVYPKWNVGDRIWVKETWAPCIGGPCEPSNPVLYRADNHDGYDQLSWRSPIFMPRWASRYLLEVTGVRGERVQDISEEDAVAEGCTRLTYRDGRGTESARLNYRTLWDSLNSKRGFGWDANPWVWVIEFRRLV